jgi:hypothetical protein
MARTARPLYLIAFGGYSDFSSLLNSGDLDAMKTMVARSEKWFEDPENADDTEERQRLEQVKSEIARLEGANVAVGASA